MIRFWVFAIGSIFADMIGFQSDLSAAAIICTILLQIVIVILLALQQPP